MLLADGTSAQLFSNRQTLRATEISARCLFVFLFFFFLSLSLSISLSPSLPPSLSPSLPPSPPALSLSLSLFPSLSGRGLLYMRSPANGTRGKACLCNTALLVRAKKVVRHMRAASGCIKLY